MEIPKSFELLHVKWRVAWHSDADMRDEFDGRSWGMCLKDEGLIVLNEKLKGRSEALRPHTFKYELVHAVMFSMGWDFDKDPHTEQLVGLVSGMLCQYDKTAKF